MTQTFWVLPQVEAKEPAPKKKRGYGAPPRKYDHMQMLVDRASGMAWEEIARKHGCKSARHAWGLAMYSKDSLALTPEQVVHLSGRKRKCP